MKGFLVAVAAALCAATATREARAQYQPIGAHDAPLDNGSGFGRGVSSAGTYTAQIPLDLPAPRGALGVPVSVVYTGARHVGAAGVGWTIPLATVHVSDTVSRRKPLEVTVVDVPGGERPAGAAERVFLNLGGSFLMNRARDTGDGKRYRPLASDVRFDLYGSPGSADWVGFDAEGRRYEFRRLRDAAGQVVDPLTWFLVEIADSTAQNRVALGYDVRRDDQTDPPEVLLTEVAYSFHPSCHYPKHRIELRYDRIAPPGIGTGFLGLSLDHGVALGQRHVLAEVRVLANDGSCAFGGDKLLWAYEFEYPKPDDDTGLPRLAEVRLASYGGPRAIPIYRPVARFAYGAASSAGKLRFGPAEMLSLPAPPDMLLGGGFSDTQGSGLSFLTRRALRDVTGDGRPDLIYPPYGGGVLRYGA